MTVETISKFYRHDFGKKLILEDKTQNPEFFFAQYGPITRRQLEERLRLTIELEGWKIDPDKDDPNSVKLVKGEIKEFPSLLKDYASDFPDHSGKGGNEIAIGEGGSILTPKMSGLEASQLYRDFTGIPIVLGSMAAQVEINFIVNGPMTKRELTQRLWKATRETGFEFQSAPGNGNLLQLVPFDLKKVIANYKHQLEQRKKSGRVRVRYVPRKAPKLPPKKPTK